MVNSLCWCWSKKEEVDQAYDRCCCQTSVSLDRARKGSKNRDASTSGSGNDNEQARVQLFGSVTLHLPKFTN